MISSSTDSSLILATIEAPAMYADHHVTEVRRRLLSLPGVEDVYASSAFKIVEVRYDPQKTTEADLINCLQEAGYLGDLMVPSEPATRLENGEKPFFRHTTVYEQTRQSVSFGQVVSYTGRPLWQCPGLGVIKKMEE
jgi:copper chaperone CopZ